MSEPIYLDYQATTPLAPEAYAAMEPWLKAGFANPHSSHGAGRKAAATVEVARGQVAGLLPGNGEVIFTSGATEAINLALRGALPHIGKQRRKLVTIATEHAAVRDTCFWLEKQGYELVLLPVGPDGLVDMDAAQAAINDETAMVAVMLVNNEIGVIQPVRELADMAHDAGALFLCDAVQGYGRAKIPGNVDMIALSAHKIHGPKGIGALWRRTGTALEPIVYGGGQENGVRSGTLSPALCAGFGAAAKLAAERFDEDHAHINGLWEQARALFADWTINGSLEHRYKGNFNIRRDGLDVARLMSDVRGVSFSAGSACASGSGRPSHVLSALGLEPGQVKSSIRLGFGRYTAEQELTRAAFMINTAAEAIIG
ncbi:cysteine desulfurase family protein [Sphingorhabdus sp. Alg239-R122]|uniref:cysteine desulfurase family protein n=1 Tax=Sphingorhabdus sp. Alg239-R122 TaxID=2305989 RepID=UPI0013DBE40D|nr:cysteine desulfurase family protein [Sphingorhabdus sp. Alg239-R122]